MMGLKLQLIIAGIIVIGILYIISLIQRNRLELKYALSWLIVAVLVLIMDIFPATMDELALFLGIASPMNMMFFMGFVFLLVIILTLTVTVSIAASSVKRLTQKIALLEKRIKELEETEIKGDKNEI